MVSKNTTVFEYPIIQGPAPPASEVTIWQQAMNVVLLQREWSDNSVSNTLYFKPRWSQVSKDDFIDQGNNVLVFKQENGPDLVVFDHGKDYIFLDTGNKYKFVAGTKKICRYNSDHEEDQVEAVLAAIAPLTKSVSLLPHSDVGIFAQMPESGITKAEYEARLHAIKPIDWSKFIGSDGQDEKYCDGDKCTI